MLSVATLPPLAFHATLAHVPPILARSSAPPVAPESLRGLLYLLATWALYLLLSLTLAWLIFFRVLVALISGPVRAEALEMRFGAWLSGQRDPPEDEEAALAALTAIQLEFERKVDAENQIEMARAWIGRTAWEASSRAQVDASADARAIEGPPGPRFALDTDPSNTDGQYAPFFPTRTPPSKESEHLEWIAGAAIMVRRRTKERRADDPPSEDERDPRFALRYGMHPLPRRSRARLLSRRGSTGQPTLSASSSSGGELRRSASGFEPERGGAGGRGDGSASRRRWRRWESCAVM